MKVIRASRYAGFCGGVKRAWDIALKEIRAAQGPVYLSGKLIHNDPAMKELEGLGLRVIDVLGSQELPPDSTVILRAHGEGPEVYAQAGRLGPKVVDATCGIVKAVQRRAQKLEQQGYQVVLFGHKKHPEALATVAYTQRGLIVESLEEAQSLGYYDRIAAIAQTTASAEEYEAVCRVLATKCRIFEDQGRICGWTLQAQEEARAIARDVAAMVVVGGRDSSNTKRLVEACASLCPTYLVETADELQESWFVGLAKVGVTAGASTRDRDIADVVKRLRRMAGSSR